MTGFKTTLRIWVELLLFVAFPLSQCSSSTSSGLDEDDELLNCTLTFPAHVLDALSHSPTGATTTSSSSTASRAFTEPYLHDCFRAHPYDVSQLPLAAGRPLERVLLQYTFVAHRVVEVSALGALTLTGSLELHWRDRLRRWNATRLGIDRIHVPANEVLSCTLVVQYIHTMTYEQYCTQCTVHDDLPICPRESIKTRTMMISCEFCVGLFRPNRNCR